MGGWVSSRSRFPQLNLYFSFNSLFAPILFSSFIQKLWTYQKSILFIFYIKKPIEEEKKKQTNNERISFSTFEQSGKH